MSTARREFKLSRWGGGSGTRPSRFQCSTLCGTMKISDAFLAKTRGPIGDQVWSSLADYIVNEQFQSHCIDAPPPTHSQQYMKPQWRIREPISNPEDQHDCQLFFPINFHHVQHQYFVDICRGSRGISTMLPHSAHRFHWPAIQDPRAYDQQVYLVAMGHPMH
jgi:hypothetical protein